VAVPASILNLVKNIVGAGILSLPSGVAAFSDAPSAVVPAAVLLLVAAAVSAYTFALIGRCCELTGTNTFREAWAKAIGEKNAWVMSLTSTGNTGLGCLMLSIILADAAASLFTALGAPAILTCRSWALLAVTGGILLPLCFLESCDAFKYTSFAGSCGLLYTVVAIVARYLEGSYLPGRHLHTQIASQFQPAIGVHGGTIWSPRALVLVSCLTVAFTAHYNAPKFYRELERRSLPRFYVVAAFGFSCAAIISVAAMLCGFLTFGGNSAGFILNNYAHKDGLIAAARTAISVSVICSYPLVFNCLREDVLEMMGTMGSSRRVMQRATLMLLGTITGLAIVLPDLGVVAAVTGALFGSAIVYVFPALIFLYAAGSNASRLERTLNCGIVLLGCVLAAVGVYASLRG